MDNGPITTINTGKFYKVYDDVVPKYLQDYIELIALGKKGKTEDVINPALDFKAKYEMLHEVLVSHRTRCCLGGPHVNMAAPTMPGRHMRHIMAQFPTTILPGRPTH